MGVKVDRAYVGLTLENMDKSGEDGGDEMQEYNDEEAEFRARSEAAHHYRFLVP